MFLLHPMGGVKIEMDRSNIELKIHPIFGGFMWWVNDMLILGPSVAHRGEETLVLLSGGFRCVGRLPRTFSTEGCSGALPSTQLVGMACGSS